MANESALELMSSIHEMIEPAYHTGIFTTQSEYDRIKDKSDSMIYMCTDTNKIYIGNIPVEDFEDKEEENNVPKETIVLKCECCGTPLRIKDKIHTVHLGTALKCEYCDNITYFGK